MIARRPGTVSLRVPIAYHTGTRSALLSLVHQAIRVIRNDWLVASLGDRQPAAYAESSGDDLSTRMDDRAHTPMSTSQMTARSQAGNPNPGPRTAEVSGAYAYQPNEVPPPRLVP